MLFTGGITSPIAENLRKTRLNFGKERIVHKIFIVEDDPVIARLVAEQLERWGYEAVCARDFAHVLEEFVAAAPQLVLLDIRLPSYSGLPLVQPDPPGEPGSCDFSLLRRRQSESGHGPEPGCR